MTDQTAFEREVDEEVRQDELKQVWDRYGNWLVGGAVATLLVTAGYLGIDAWTQGRLKSASDNYQAASTLLQESKWGEASTAFAELREAAGGYGTLSRFQEADALVKAGDRQGAVAVYDAMASNGDVSKTYRTLAGLKAAYLVADSATPEDLLARIGPQMTPENPWIAFFRDLEGMAHIKAGDLDDARNAYRLVSADANAPQGLKTRARRMTEFLEGALAVQNQSSDGADRAAPSNEQSTGGQQQ